MGSLPPSGAGWRTKPLPGGGWHQDGGSGSSVACDQRRDAGGGALRQTRPEGERGLASPSGYRPARSRSGCGQPRAPRHIDANKGGLVATISANSAGVWLAADDAGVWLSAWNPDRSNDAGATFVSASTNAPAGTPGHVYNFRPFAVGEGRVWFISGPHDPGLPAGGICGLNRSEEHTSELQSHVNLVCRL